MKKSWFFIFHFLSILLRIFKVKNIQMQFGGRIKKRKQKVNRVRPWLNASRTASSQHHLGREWNGDRPGITTAKKGGNDFWRTLFCIFYEKKPWLNREKNCFINERKNLVDMYDKKKICSGQKAISRILLSEVTVHSNTFNWGRIRFFKNTFIWKSTENNGDPHKPHTDLIIRSLENRGWSR